MSIQATGSARLRTFATISCATRLTFVTAPDGPLRWDAAHKNEQ